jgi:hypothetical protein
MIPVATRDPTTARTATTTTMILHETAGKQNDAASIGR